MTTSEVRFDTSFQPGKYRLLELDDHLLEELGLKGDFNGDTTVLPTKLAPPVSCSSCPCSSCPCSCSFLLASN